MQAAGTALFAQTDGKNRSGASALPAGSSKQIVLTGTVERIENKQKVDAVYLRDNHISISDHTVSEPKVLVYIGSDQREKTTIKAGNRLRVSGEAQSFDEARNPGNFDQRFYYEKQGIYILVWAQSVEVVSAETDRLKDFLQGLRTTWSECLTAHLGDYYGAAMSAILLGEKSGLDVEMKKLYQKNGIGHILAISGLHMSFIGAGLYGLLRRMGLPFLAAASFGGSILILYTLMIGQSVSAVRALLMFLIRAGADVLGRDYDLPTSLSVSAAAACAWQPLFLQDASYLLSYGAILGITLLTPVFEDMVRRQTPPTRREKEKKKGPVPVILKCAANAGRYVTAGFCSSIAVSVFLMGPLLYFYFEVPPYSFLLNLAVIPAMTLVMGAGLAGSFLALFSGALGGLALSVCRAVLMAYDALCSLAGHMPGSRFVTGRPGALWLWVYYSGVLFLYLTHRFLKRRQRKLRKDSFREDGDYPGILRIPGAVLLCFSVLMPAVCRAGYHHMEGIQVTVLDVGQGDGIFIRSPSGKAYFVDGGSSDISSPGTYRIEPFLLSSGADSLEYVFLSHGDADHINGIQEMLENQEMGVHIKTLVLPPERYMDEALAKTARLAEKNGTRVAVMKPGDILSENADGGEFNFACLAPDDSLPEGAEGNAASLVLKLSYGDFSMLLTGDLEGEGEKTLAESGALSPCTVLKAAHHGSKSSGSEEFLDIVRPSFAIISAGRDNRYGHPHAEALERLKNAGCTVYSTQDCGALSVYTDGKSVKISGFVPLSGDKNDS